ncbi:MAG: TonB-dependent receptor plug domain-containing protein [Gammaproteobacteria bacterium]|nr:TonB-dependent receptor plug domain-containing protein [Gammaproteobacteria bacterium]
MKNHELSRCLYFGLVFTLYLPQIAQSLETIVVSDSRFDTSIYDTAAAITVISEKEIRLSGADHIIDALRNSGGLQISDLFGDGTDASIGLRGFSSTAGQNTLIMIDGRRLNNTDNGLPDLNSLSTHDIDRVEVVKSSMSTLYGDKAVGGIINVITKKSRAVGIHANVKYGSYDNRQAYGSIENYHDNGIEYRISAQHHLTDNYRDNNRLELTNLNARAAYHHDKGQLFVELQGSKQGLQLPGALFSDLLRRDRRQALNSGDEIQTDTTAGRLGVQYFILPQVQFRVEYTNRFNDITGTISSAGNAEKFSSKRHHRELTPRFNLSFELLGLESILYMGLDWFETDYLIQSRFGLTDNTQTQYGYYGRLMTSITDRFKLISGFRHGAVNNNILVDTLSFGRSLPEGTELDDTANAFELGFSYQLNPSWRLFSRIDRNYRFVTADEYSAIADNNFFSQLFAFGTTVPIPVTQQGYSLEAGISWENSDHSQLSMQVYRLDIDDEIVFDPVLFLNTNLGDSRRNGLILEGRHAITEQITLAGSYSYLDAKFTSGQFVGKELTFLPEHSARASLSYELNDKTGMFIEWLGQGKRLFDGDYANEFEQLPGYATFNVNTWHRIGNIQMSLKVNNIFDRHYSDSGIIGFDFRQPFPSPLAETYYPAPGINFMLSLSYSK